MPYDGEQLEIFPRPAAETVADRMALEILAEIAAMARAAREAIDRRIAFYHRSNAQRRRFERYRKLIATYGDQK